MSNLNGPTVFNLSYPIACFDLSYTPPSHTRSHLTRGAPTMHDNVSDFQSEPFRVWILVLTFDRTVSRPLSGSKEPLYVRTSVETSRTALVVRLAIFSDEYQIANLLLAFVAWSKCCRRFSERGACQMRLASIVHDLPQHVTAFPNFDVDLRYQNWTSLYSFFSCSTCCRNSAAHVAFFRGARSDVLNRHCPGQEIQSGCQSECHTGRPHASSSRRPWCSPRPAGALDRENSCP